MSGIENPTAILIDSSGVEKGTVGNPVVVTGTAGVAIQPVLEKDVDGVTVPATAHMRGEMLSEMRQIRKLLEILTDEKVHDEE